jgi:hypothetical protein
MASLELVFQEDEPSTLGVAVGRGSPGPTSVGRSGDTAVTITR